MIKYRIIFSDGFTEFEDETTARACRDTVYPESKIQKLSVETVDDVIEIPQDDGSVTNENRPKEIETILEDF